MFDGKTIENLIGSVERAEDHAKEVTAEQRAQAFKEFDEALDWAMEQYQWARLKNMSGRTGNA